MFANWKTVKEIKRKSDKILWLLRLFTFDKALNQVQKDELTV